MGYKRLEERYGGLALPVESICPEKNPALIWQGQNPHLETYSGPDPDQKLEPHGAALTFVQSLGHK
jgi:hypothetical protein